MAEVMTFPPAGAEIYRNEIGEVTGWGAPESKEMYYHDICGYHHADDACPLDDDDNEDDTDTEEEDQAQTPV
jgi:hypothetical protein